MIKFQTKKKLGQHFLINETIAKSISNTFEGRNNILEIGPGMGFLTKYIIKGASNLILVEIDSVLESNAEEFVKSYVQKGGQ